MVDEILDDIRDATGARFSKWACIRAINEAYLPVTSAILKVKENLLVNLDNEGLPASFDIPPAGIDGASRVKLPPTVGQITEVALKVGSNFVPIGEQRRGEWLAGVHRPSVAGAPIQDMRYQIAYPFLEIWPGVSSTQAGALQLRYECQIPKLFMGKVVSPGASSFTLPSAVDKAEGNLIPSFHDDAYNRMRVFIFEGTGAGQYNQVLDYAGSTRVLTFVSAWSPGLNAADSKFAFMSPFYGLLADMDELLKIRACIVLLGTKRNEDVSSFVARYNELEEACINKIEPITPGPQTIVPVDALDDALYY